jgi:hypothetical protein
MLLKAGMAITDGTFWSSDPGQELTRLGMNSSKPIRGSWVPQL